MAKYKYINPKQSEFVYLNYSELFPEDHPTSRLLNIIDNLDLSDFDNQYSNGTSKGGRSAIPVNRLLAILIYSLLYGNISMRNLEREIAIRADLMYLAGGLSIDHSTFSRFRSRHSEAITNLFTQTVFLGVESGLIALDTISIDGTKIKASANRRDIGKKEELQRRFEHIEEACRSRIREWDATNNEEEKKALEKKLKRNQNQLERLKAGIQFLQENPKKKRVHLTDKDADWQKGRSDQFIVGYNVQAAVDSKSQMIVAEKVSSTQADSQEAVPMVEAVEKIRRECQSVEQIKYVMDCGYASEENLINLKEKDIYIPDRELAREFAGKIKPEDRKPINVLPYDEKEDCFICPMNKKINFYKEKKLSGKIRREYRLYGCGSCQKRRSCIGGKGNRKSILVTKNNQKSQKTHTDRMRKKLNTKEGRKIYSTRFGTVEPVFGTIKEVRNGNRFMRRTIERVRVEWTERCIAHNIGKLIKFQRI